MINEQQLEELKRLDKLQMDLTSGWIKYWDQYSSFNDWHFWLLVVLAILPLVVLFFFIDRRRMFYLGFFGLNVHIWHSYVDVASVELGKWTFPYKLIPIFPISFAFDASFIPVTFLLVYQWTLNHNKNFYLYSTIPAFFFGFIAKPILVAINITKPGEGGGGLKAYLILFISHLIISYVSKWITDFFGKLQIKENSVSTPSKSLNWFSVRKKLR